MPIIKLQDTVRIRKLSEGGMSVAKIAQAYGISEQQVEGYLPKKEKKRAAPKKKKDEPKVKEPNEFAS